MDRAFGIKTKLTSGASTHPHWQVHPYEEVAYEVYRIEDF